MHINQLVDDCLLEIFDQLEIVDLLRLEAVCSKWKILHQQTCQRKRTLVLVEALIYQRYQCVLTFTNWAEGSSLPKHDYLIISKYQNPQTISLIIRKFPAIRSFEFYLYKLHLKSMLDLLGNWTNSLTYLKIDTINMWSSLLYEEWQQLINALGTLVPKLEHLLLYNLFPKKSNVYDLPTGLPLLKR